MSRSMERACNGHVCQSDYLIGMADILGFKKFFKRKDFDLDKLHRTIQNRTHDLPRNFSEMANQVINGIGTKDKKFSSFYQTQKSIFDSFKVFSDTVFFFIEMDGTETHEEIVSKFLAMSDVMVKVITTANLYPRDGTLYQLALRGAIAFGRCSIDEEMSIFLGQPVIDAHILSEAQEWMGAAIHPSVFDILDLDWEESSGLVDFDETIYRYPVPLKEEYCRNPDNKKVKFAINWIPTRVASRDYFPNMPVDLPARPLYRDVIENNFLKYDWEEETMKKENTLTFADSIFHHYDRPGSKYYWVNQKEPNGKSNQT